uniref:UBX domain-containing protein 4 n=1 Tax=Globodera pallida TaxID=36090 RepID=A0A183BVA4_GLOPA
MNLGEMEWYSGDVTSALSNYQEKKGILIVYVYADDSSKFDLLWSSFDHSILNHVPYVAIRLAKDTEGANQFAQFFPTPVFPLYQDQKKDQGLNSAAATNTGQEVQKDDQKLEYYRKRLEEKHKEDAKKKEEEEREKEVLRRNEGKALTDIREKQREKEMKEMSEQRRKQKDEDAQALKRIRDQLRQDKEDRAKRNAGPQAEVENKEEPLKQEKSEGTLVRTPVNTEQCRIQCKFPDGSTLIEVYSSGAPLQVVYDAVSHNPHAPPNFFLVQPYPRKKLTEFDKTLLELDLTPSSALLVVAIQSQLSVLPSSGYMDMLLGFVFFPFYLLGSVWRFFTSLFTGGRSGQILEKSGNASTSAQNSTGEKKKGESSKTERSGNVGSFRAEGSDHSDDEATWNGNSTQQL